MHAAIRFLKDRRYSQPTHEIFTGQKDFYIIYIYNNIILPYFSSCHFAWANSYPSTRPQKLNVLPKQGEGLHHKYSSYLDVKRNTLNIYDINSHQTAIFYVSNFVMGAITIPTCFNIVSPHRYSVHNHNTRFRYTLLYSIPVNLLNSTQDIESV